MKTYKTWEMIKELTENPRKEFISRGTPPFANLKAYWFTDQFDIENIKIINLDCKNEVYKYPLNIDWEEIKKPVDFMTAFRAYREGKTILSVSDSGKRYRYRPYENTGNDFHEDEIANWKWYVED